LGEGLENRQRQSDILRVGASGGGNYNQTEKSQKKNQKRGRKEREKIPLLYKMSAPQLIGGEERRGKNSSTRSRETVSWCV